MCYDFNHVGRILHALGFSVQKPEARARERDEQAALFAKPGTPFPAGEAVVAAATDPAARAREDLVHVLLNHNDFVTIR